MKASKTELLSLFKQAFEACGLDVGAYQSAAELVVWAQMHGLQSFDSVANRLPEFSVMQCPPIELLVDSRHQLEIDLRGSSMFFCADLVSDLIYAKAVTSGYCAARIADCREPGLILKKLVDNRARGLSGLACWRDGELLRTARSAPAKHCPEIIDLLIHDENAEQIPGHQSLFLLYATDEETMQQHIAGYCPFLSGEVHSRISPAEMQAHYRAALDGGVEISDRLWQALVSLANKVLVESSEQSRRGAGA